MSMLMVRPGPLEGGPMVSPGPAKESGEPFSAHLKQACDQGASAPAASKTSPNPSEQSERPGKENEASLKEADTSKESRPAGVPRPLKGKGMIPIKGSEKVSDGVPETTIVDSALLGNPETVVDPLLSNIPLALGQTSGEKVKTEGDPSVSLSAKTVDIPPTELLAVSTETPDEALADSETPQKDEPVNVEAKPLEAPTADLLPVNLAVVVPHESSVVIEDETPLAPVVDVKEEAVPVPQAPTNGSIPESVPVLEGPKLAADLDKDVVPLPKAPDLKKVISPKDSPEPPKKKTESSSVIEVVDERPVDRPDLRVALNPVPQGIRPEPKDSVTQNTEKEVQREAPHVKEAPLPAVVFQTDVVAPVPVTTDAVPKLKETGIAPVHSGTGAPNDASVHLIKESTQMTEPVLEGSPAKAGSPVDLARQIHVHLESGRSVVRIDLHPEHLGELRISMETKGKEVSMQFTVENDNARTTVVAGLREITGTLSSLGWNVNGLAVNVSSGGVGNGRGDANGPQWGQSKNLSNTLPAEPHVSAPRQGTGEWRVDLVA